MPALSDKREVLKTLTRTELYGAVLERRKVLRTHRDQVGDDRCWADDWLLFALVEGLESKIAKPDFQTGMVLCTRFYNHCKLDHVLPESRYVITNPKRWDKDLLGMSEVRLLEKLERIQLEIVVLYNVVKHRTPKARDYLRLYKRTLPEGIMPDLRLPSEPEFLGEAKRGVGCLQFWRSHANCPLDICNLHQWGPCS